MKAPEKALTIQVNGITIAYEDSGKGTIPIIFIHGFPFNKTTWKPQVKALKSTYRVISYDIRGFGKSTTNNEAASMDLFANDLIAFMDALEIPKAIVCGLSMGGYIVMNAVSRCPERFEAIILSDTQCIADSNDAKEKRYQTIEQIKAEGLTHFAENFIKTVFCKKTLAHKKELVEEVKQIILATPVQSIASTLHALAQRRESCALLKTISVPALIICGKDDTLAPLPQSESLLSIIPGSQLQTIRDAGHLSNLEQPDEFTAHIHNFLPGFLS
jgi:3-oxoadipate enol-lactonase